MRVHSFLAATAALLASVVAHADSLVFPAANHTGCLPLTATLTLTTAADVGGQVFDLTSSDDALLAAPPTATVAEGATSVVIPLNTGHVGENTIVTLTADDGTSTLNRSVTLRANAPISISAPSSLGPNAVSSGSFTLSCVAPAGGHIVTMTSTSASLAVPASVTVNAGEASAAFSLVAEDFSVSEAVFIAAARGGLSKSRRVTLKLPTPKTVAFASSIPIGGTPTTGTVTLDLAAGAAGVVVAISSDNPSLAGPDVDQVTVAAGNTQASFGITTQVTNTQAEVVFTATANGVSAVRTLTVRPNRVETIRTTQFTISACRGVDAEVELLVPAGADGASVALSVDRADLVTLTPAVLSYGEDVEDQPFTATTTAAPTTPQAAIISAELNITKILRVNVVRTSQVGCP